MRWCSWRSFRPASCRSQRRPMMARSTSCLRARAGRRGAASPLVAGILSRWRVGAGHTARGWLAYVRDTDQLLSFAGSGWALFAPGKLLTLSASDKLVGRSSSGAGAAEEITCTPAGRALIDDADAAAQRTSLGLGTAAAQNTGASHTMSRSSMPPTHGAPSRPPLSPARARRQRR